MAVYTTLPDMKTRLGIGDTQSDPQLTRAIESASRSIEDTTGRRFDADLAATPRQYRTIGNIVVERDGDLILVDDISSLVDLIVETGDGTTWTVVSDYLPEPANALDRGRPITKLRRDLWPEDRVRVTARWGWPSVPAAIREATEILAERLFRRKDAPYGVAGFGEFGVVRVTQTDPDVAALIGPYIAVGA